ncbi:cyclin-K-like [Belonocnema kinseyi]|uniref:cyclin-K-like n=1 Tax=Belonocnema kinseyi TaxID=2817044 RepID=UPI00143CE285|nr:cyclin-K-like [Belonocnema kinseyi]
MNCFQVLDWKGKKPNQKKWWDLFVEDLNKDILDDIGHQVLNIYSVAKAPLLASLPNAGKRTPKAKSRVLDTSTPPPAVSNSNSSVSNPKRIIAPVSNG